MLGLSRLINFFNEKNISFIDLLILSQESMKELELEMYQRNRIFNFSKFYNKTAKNYSKEEIIKFFQDHKQFIFVPKIYEQIISNKININFNQESPRFSVNNLKNKKQTRNSTTKKIKKGKNQKCIIVIFKNFTHNGQGRCQVKVRYKSYTVSSGLPQAKVDLR